ncbi:MAG: MBL fold metallo-hydrolase [Lachnospiraceae bacterium]|nr:MBL fold metallo-hydrolase [Ruminococcus sp.]MCM1274053.1 MBL fold metallo-hydrolase [Lachnospiraceae bacterium]
MKLKKISLALAIFAFAIFQCGCGMTAPPPRNDADGFSAAVQSPPSESVPDDFREFPDGTSEQPPAPGLLRVHFIDVGQGDGIFIELPNGETMLIDAGEPSAGDKVVDYIFTEGYDAVNYVIATHPHDDHIGGMAAVLDNFTADGFYLTTAESAGESYEKMLAAATRNGVETHYVSAGDVILSGGNLLAEVVAPKTTDINNPNDTSVVVKLTYGSNKFLFTGDAEKYEEDNIWTNIKCDVLKVGHHGSSTSTSKNFLKKTEPTYAVISAGLNNSYGHPTEKTLKSLSENGIQIYRTDLQGTVIFTSDGTNITVNKQPSEYTPPAEETSSVSEPRDGTYVLNTNTRKIHYPDCRSVKDIKLENKETTDDFEEALAQGYKPCGSCKPTG